jgi:hypothetical protein
MDKNEISGLIDKLIELGEDREELQLWLEIYDDLPQEKQIALGDNLKRELESLQQ